MRRALLAVFLVGLWLIPASPARAQEPAPLFILGLPEVEARRFVQRHAGSVGLGVNPGSRLTEAFLIEVGATAPAVSREFGSALDGEPGRLAALIGHERIAGSIAPSMRGLPIASLLDALTIEPAPPSEVAAGAEDRALVVFIVATADDADALIRLALGRRAPTASAWVIGDGAQTPVFLGFTRPFSLPPGSVGVFDGSETRRAGLATPYDVAATILADLGLDPGEASGRRLNARPDADPFATIATVGAELEDDPDVGLPLAVAGVALALAGLLGGAIALAFGRWRLAGALARGAALVPAGFVGALFLDSDRWEVRAIAIAAAFVAGVALPVRDPRRIAGWALLGTSAAVAVLAVAAASDPEGGVAASLWGNPLTSWRYFGLPNHLASFVAGGAIVGTALLAFPWWVLLPVVAGAGTALGAASIGANFVAVLTLGFGAVVAALALAAGRVRLWHLPLAAIVGVAALSGALVADSSDRVSHGGRAFETIRDGGFDAARSIVEARARLSIDEVQALGRIGWGLTAALGLLLVLLYAWAWRARREPAWARAAVAGGAAAALAAMVTEDTGLFTAGALGLFPLVAFLGSSAQRQRLGPITDLAPPELSEEMLDFLGPPLFDRAEQPAEDSPEEAGPADDDPTDALPPTPEPPSR